jgi:hypothetical protein
MNLIICKPAKSVISDALLKRLELSNTDLFGLAVAKNDKIIIRKNFSKFETFLKCFKENEKNSCLINLCDKPFTGDNIQGFCGPYRVDNDLVFSHYGRFFNFDSKLPKPKFCHSLNLLIKLKSLCSINSFGKEYFQWIIEKALPSNNKLAILCKDGCFQIFNSLSDWWDAKDCDGVKISEYLNLETFSTRSSTIYTNSGPRARVCYACQAPLVGFTFGKVYHGQKYCTVCFDRVWTAGYNAAVKEKLYGQSGNIIPFTDSSSKPKIESNKFLVKSFLKGEITDKELSIVEIGELI